jgi:hypothetical protein
LLGKKCHFYGVKNRVFFFAPKSYLSQFNYTHFMILLNEHENQLTVQQVRREELELENDDVLDVNEEEFESNPE